jgi:ribosome-binding factor A
MSAHRNLRMAEAIREVVSSAILFEVADPRVHSVTVLGVELTGDLRNATVSVSILGTEQEQDLAMKGLRSAAGFLQARVAARLQTRFTPILHFKRDDSVKKSITMSRLIEEALASDRHAPAPASASASELDPLRSEPSAPLGGEDPTVDLL